GITVGFAAFPLWKVPGVAPDLVATAFGVTFGTCLGAKLTLRWDIARGRVEPAPAASAPWHRRLPEGVLMRSVWLGLWSVPIFAVPMLLGLWLTGLREMDRLAFILLKAGF